MNDVDSDMRALLSLARRAEDPTFADRARVRKRLAVTLAAASAGSAASTASGAERAMDSGTHFATPSIPAAAKAGAWLGALKTGFGQAVLWAVFGTAAAGGAWYLSGSSPHAVLAPPPVTSPVKPSKAAAASRAPAARADESAPAVASVSPMPALAPEPVPARGRRATRSAPLPRLSLAEEARELAGVHAALHRGESAAALSQLDAMDRHRGGALREERLAARVLALCALGRTREAEAAARRFQALAPESPLLPRLTASCAQRALGERN